MSRSAGRTLYRFLGLLVIAAGVIYLISVGPCAFPAMRSGDGNGLAAMFTIFGFLLAAPSLIFFGAGLVLFFYKPPPPAVTRADPPAPPSDTPESGGA